MMTVRLFFSLAWLTISISATAAATDLSPASETQTAKIFEKKITRSVRMNYLLHLPAGYKASGSQKWPLLVFLHGAGEVGTNVTLVKKHGPPKLVATQPDFPFILLSPQSPRGQYGWSDEAVLALIHEVTSKHRVDRKRIYLTGLSMGGYGTWSLATSHPEMFAAIAPLCGGGDAENVAEMKQSKGKVFESLGVWAFHGAKDKDVPLSESQDMVNAFKKAGCKDIQFTVYPEARHDCWTEAYNNPKLYEWFLQHRRD